MYRDAALREELVPKIRNAKARIETRAPVARKRNEGLWANMLDRLACAAPVRVET
jgi:hypothetical protein